MFPFLIKLVRPDFDLFMMGRYINLYIVYVYTLLLLIGTLYMIIISLCNICWFGLFLFSISPVAGQFVY